MKRVKYLVFLLSACKKKLVLTVVHHRWVQGAETILPHVESLNQELEKLHREHMVKVQGAETILPRVESLN